MGDAVACMKDWPVIIKTIQGHMRLVDIAVHCNRSEAWVIRLRDGEIKDPQHHTGQLLLDLYIEVEKTQVRD